MTVGPLKEDMVLLGVLIQHSWHKLNCLWLNVKSSQPDVGGGGGVSFPANRKLGSIAKTNSLINHRLLISLKRVEVESSAPINMPSNGRFDFKGFLFHFLSSSRNERVSSCRVWYYSVTLGSSFHSPWSVCTRQSIMALVSTTSAGDLTD